MNTLADALAQAVCALEESSNPDARLEAEVLVMHLVDLSRAQLYSRQTELLAPAQLTALHELAGRRRRGEPLAYITGHREFFGLDFQVDRRVLIPRPETELLVEAASGWLRHYPGPMRLADIGAGSGAIAVSLAVNFPEVSLYATDISVAALEVAKTNAARHGVAERITFLQGDLLTPLAGPIDLLVANLPYVKEGQLPWWCGASPVELAWEPRGALAGGADGLDLIRRFLLQAPRYLRAEGAVFLEVGWDQGPAVRDLAQRAFPGARVSLHQDLAGLDRVIAIACTG